MEELIGNVNNNMTYVFIYVYVNLCVESHSGGRLSIPGGTVAESTG